MSLKPCVECGKEISSGAKACPHCGKVQPKRFGAPFIIAIVLLVIAASSGLFDSPGGKKTGTPDEIRAQAQKEIAEAERTKNRRDYRDAFQKCREMATLSLRAPSTADFSRPESGREFLDNSALVTGYVDAENSFGAKLRTYFTCEATREGSVIEVAFPTFRGN